MTLYSLSFGQIIGAQECSLTNTHAALSRVYTDTRSIVDTREAVFVAITTPSGDGHRYIQGAYKAGIRNFIVESSLERLVSLYPETNWWRVGHSLQALQDWASHVRKACTCPIVGITGSNGKTITKEFIYQLLMGVVEVVRSPLSYNSQIGVPLSVLQLYPGAELGLFEAGISQPHEMERLEHILRPEIGIFTCLGTAHSEHFESPTLLLEEKLRLFKHSSHIVTSIDDSRVMDALKARGWAERIVGWSRERPDACIYVSGEQIEEESTHLTLNQDKQIYHFVAPFTDRAHLDDLLCALTFVLRFYPQALDHAAETNIRLSLSPIEMRLRVQDSLMGNTIIDDSYSNDIVSLEVALDFLRRRAHSSRKPAMLILSDMVGSGHNEQERYREVGDLCQRYGVEHFVGIGDNLIAHQVDIPVSQASFYHTVEELLNSGYLQEQRGVCMLIKGARHFALERIWHMLYLREHQTILEINLSALKHNFAYFRSLMPPDHKLICMVKADAYGLGAIEIARTLQEHRVSYLAVAVADEGKLLRLSGIHTPIIVMNPESGSLSTLLEYHLEPEVYSPRLLQELLKELERMEQCDFPIHLKLDTGMHRLGFSEGMIPELITLLRGASRIRVASIFSHLACADDLEQDRATECQFTLYDNMYHQITQALGYQPQRHILNTAGILRFPERAMDMARLGIGLYGISPTLGIGQEIRPVARLTTTILQTRWIEAGEPVSYGGRERTTRRTRLGVLPIGYADGFSRALGLGRYSVWVGSHLCPTIGVICMDACMIDLTDAPEVQEGDMVIIFGSPERPIEQIAQIDHTIPYEILTSISSRVPRLYVQD